MPGFAPLPALGWMTILAYVAVLPLTITALASRSSRATSSIRHLFAGGCSLLWQGLVLLIGIKQHANVLVNSMLFYCFFVMFGTMCVCAPKTARSGGRTRIYPSRRGGFWCF